MEKPKRTVKKPVDVKKQLHKARLIDYAHTGKEETAEGFMEKISKEELDLKIPTPKRTYEDEISLELQNIRTGERRELLKINSLGKKPENYNTSDWLRRPLNPEATSTMFKNPEKLPIQEKMRKKSRVTKFKKIIDKLKRKQIKRK